MLGNRIRRTIAEPESVEAFGAGHSTPRSRGFLLCTHRLLCINRLGSEFGKLIQFINRNHDQEIKDENKLYDHH